MSSDDAAFPQPLEDGERYYGVSGLTRRELFAAMCMQGLLSDSTCSTNPRDAAIAAVSYANALLSELERKKK